MQIDELVDRLANVVPSRSKDLHALASVSDIARTSLRARIDGEDCEEEDVPIDSSKPLPLDEALNALDEAARNGEAGKWVSILSRQLNAEREQDLEQRRQRVAAKQRNLMQERLSL